MAQEITPEMQALKARLKSTWESGDYSAFARYIEPGALAFLDRLELPAGTTLLDVACGDGQLTLPAAMRGIKVTGLDLAQNLVDKARARARNEGLDLPILQGDAEDMPYENASFDVVLSLFGAMFAPRPGLVVSEMARVCRPGGKIIMGNWTPAGHIGQMFQVIGKFAPPPAIFPSPLLWGDEDRLRERFRDRVRDLRITPRLYPLCYPFPPAEVVNFFNTHYGPTVRLFSAFDDATKAAFNAELTALWQQNNRATDDTTYVLSEYVEVIGICA